MDALETMADEIIRQYDPSLRDGFLEIVRFSRDNPDLQALPRRSKLNPNPKFGTADTLEWLARKYVNGRKPSQLPVPGTIPDPVLATVMVSGYRIRDDVVDDLVDGHRIAMVAENVIGELLERYIDSSIGAQDWVWCAGEVVRSVDFIRAGRDEGVRWESLQIKNRDNSENSSSSAIRKGTQIKKWYRTVSRTGKTRWAEFPVGVVGVDLSEQGFRAFVSEYLQSQAQMLGAVDLSFASRLRLPDN